MNIHHGDRLIGSLASGYRTLTGVLGGVIIRRQFGVVEKARESVPVGTDVLGALGELVRAGIGLGDGFSLGMDLVHDGT